MDAEHDSRPALWDLAVLCLLRERAMHPYEMQRLLRERHKDEVLVLKRGSLYHAINRLQRSQLIEAVATGRDGRRPERTTYCITDAGQRALLRWLRTLVAVPEREPSEFMAAVSFLVYLTPEDAVAQLEQRSVMLEKEIAEFSEVLSAATPRAGRINLLETEYARAMRAAELAWVRHMIDDVRSGQLTWDLEAILQQIRAAARPAAVPEELSR